MQTIRYGEADFKLKLAPLMDRTAFDPEIERGVAAILQRVRGEGDAALVEFARTFDKAELTPAQFRVTEDEIAAACREVDARTKQAIRLACRQVKDFARRRLPKACSVISCSLESRVKDRLLPDTGAVRDSTRTARPPASTSTSS